MDLTPVTSTLTPEASVPETEVTLVLNWEQGKNQKRQVGERLNQRSWEERVMARERKWAESERRERTQS